MKLGIRIGTKWKTEVENMTRNVRTVDKCGEKVFGNMMEMERI